MVLRMAFIFRRRDVVFDVGVLGINSTTEVSSSL
jgi:hypothetical protein